MLILSFIFFWNSCSYSFACLMRIESAAGSLPSFKRAVLNFWMLLSQLWVLHMLFFLCFFNLMLVTTFITRPLLPNITNIINKNKATLPFATGNFDNISSISSDIVTLNVSIVVLIVAALLSMALLTRRSTKCDFKVDRMSYAKSWSIGRDYLSMSGRYFIICRSPLTLA